jgi:hypothetical protein
MQNKKLWFRAKNYGWGWYPVTWQGYLVTILYVLAIFKIAFRAVKITEATNDSDSTFLWNYLPPLLVISLVMIWICYKTGEKPEWRWNGKKIGSK